MPHGAGLRKLTKDIQLVESISNLEFQSPSIDSADHALLSYAIKLTRTPSAISADDVESLRSQGFDDLGIQDICQVAAYFNYVNRIAEGLSVELEAEMTDL